MKWRAENQVTRPNISPKSEIKSILNEIEQWFLLVLPPICSLRGGSSGNFAKLLQAIVKCFQARVYTYRGRLNLLHYSATACDCETQYRATMYASIRSIFSKKAMILTCLPRGLIGFGVSARLTCVQENGISKSAHHLVMEFGV